LWEKNFDCQSKELVSRATWGTLPWPLDVEDEYPGVFGVLPSSTGKFFN